MRRETPSWRARSRVDGTRAPGRSAPSRIARRTPSSIWAPSVAGRSRATSSSSSTGLLVSSTASKLDLPPAPVDRNHRAAHPSGPAGPEPPEDTMGRIVATEYISVDGVIEAPSGPSDFARAGWTDAYTRGTRRGRLHARPGHGGRGAADGPADLRAVRGGMAAVRGRVRRPHEHDAEVRRLRHPDRPPVAQHDGAERRSRQRRGAPAGRARRRHRRVRQRPPRAGARSRRTWSTSSASSSIRSSSATARGCSARPATCGACAWSSRARSTTASRCSSTSAPREPARCSCEPAHDATRHRSRRGRVVRGAASGPLPALTARRRGASPVPCAAWMRHRSGPRDRSAPPATP